MFYLVYRIKNKINKKIYIGVHQTTNIDDGYMGSGTILKRAVKKHGLENFEKTILHVFDNVDDMFAREKELVTEEFVARLDTYNISVGGNGSWDYVNRNGLNIQNCSKAGKVGGKVAGNTVFLKKTGIFDPKYTKEEKIEWHCHAREKAKKAWLGKKHTNESKRKIGIANSIHQTGSKNSQYGKIWIHNLIERKSKSIHRENLQSFLEKGWLIGRKINFCD